MRTYSLTTVSSITTEILWILLGLKADLVIILANLKPKQIEATVLTK